MCYKFVQMKIVKYFLSIFLMSGFISCKQVNVYEYNTNIPLQKWNAKFSADGSFVIKDTAALYNIYIVLRHLDSYKYNNIWLNVGLAQGKDSLYFQKLNLTLGDDASGWEGVGMNDIWEVRKLINGRPKKFVKAGEYHFRIFQVMRDNPLPGVLSAGLRVEKAD